MGTDTLKVHDPETGVTIRYVTTFGPIEAPMPTKHPFLMGRARFLEEWERFGWRVLWRAVYGEVQSE